MSWTYKLLSMSRSCMSDSMLTSLVLEIWTVQRWNKERSRVSVGHPFMGSRWVESMDFRWVGCSNDLHRTSMLRGTSAEVHWNSTAANQVSGVGWRPCTLTKECYKYLLRAYRKLPVIGCSKRRKTFAARLLVVVLTDAQLTFSLVRNPMWPRIWEFDLSTRLTFDPEGARIFVSKISSNVRRIQKLRSGSRNINNCPKIWPAWKRRLKNFW